MYEIPERGGNAREVVVSADVVHGNAQPRIVESLAA